jgi:hypothetical protein
VASVQRVCSELCRAVDVDGVYPARLLRPLAHDLSRDDTQNTSSYFTRTERIALAQGAIDQLIAHSFPPGTLAALSESASGRLNFTLTYTLEDALVIIGAISRKDLVSGTQDNKAYVNGELGGLTWNDLR